MLICGGAIAGYCDTGRPMIESAPATITRMPTTHAKMGLSMKNWATPALLGPGVPWFGGERPLASARGLLRAAGRDGVHRGAWADLLQPLDDDLLARLHAGRDEPRVADGAVGHELPPLDLLVGGDHERGRQPLLIARDAHLRDEERLRVHALVEPRADEHAGHELALRVREERAERDRPRARIDGDVGELERAGEAVLLAVLGHEPHLRPPVPGALELSALEVAPEPQHLRGRLREIDVHGIELLHRREQRRLRLLHVR